MGGYDHRLGETGAGGPPLTRREDVPESLTAEESDHSTNIAERRFKNGAILLAIVTGYANACLDFNAIVTGQFFLMEELQICDRTVVDWTNFCRELLQQWITNGQKQIGGPGVTVEIDEAKIGKRKYNKGRIVKGQWVFGGIDRESDSWKAYSGLQNANYSHYTVNHKQNFIDPATGAHTQNIERLWRDMRAAIPRYGTRTYHYNGYLAEFIFKKQSNFGDRIDSFLK
ncbi:uncharacterized protein LOC116849325 [Odontomachus brunneus]|uniref:uncharacterized protein LOC116849325 n=1 Tax=Odontomachus brunneus TaxID=486640 RepID=UPI0013F23952|nr:uncharacterized protein LOC116849325 [Odontomachus brunneus]